MGFLPIDSRSKKHFDKIDFSFDAVHRKSIQSGPDRSIDFKFCTLNSARKQKTGRDERLIPLASTGAAIIFRRSIRHRFDRIRTIVKKSQKSRNRLHQKTERPPARIQTAHIMSENRRCRFITNPQPKPPPLFGIKRNNIGQSPPFQPNSNIFRTNQFSRFDWIPVAPIIAPFERINDPIPLRFFTREKRNRCKTIPFNHNFNRARQQILEWKRNIGRIPSESKKIKRFARIIQSFRILPKPSLIFESRGSRNLKPNVVRNRRTSFPIRNLPLNRRRKVANRQRESEKRKNSNQKSGFHTGELIKAVVISRPGKETS